MHRKNLDWLLDIARSGLADTGDNALTALNDFCILAKVSPNAFFEDNHSEPEVRKFSARTNLERRLLIRIAGAVSSEIKVHGTSNSNQLRFELRDKEFLQIGFLFSVLRRSLQIEQEKMFSSFVFKHGLDSSKNNHSITSGQFESLIFSLEEVLPVGSRSSPLRVSHDR